MNQNNVFEEILRIPRRVINSLQLKSCRYYVLLDLNEHTIPSKAVSRIVWSTHEARVRINRVRLPILLVVSRTGKINNISLSPFAPEIWSRETGSAVSSRVSLLISILRLNLVLTYGIPPDFRGGVHLFILNRHTPSGQSRVYRVTQVRTDRVHCRESDRASRPQCSSKRVLPWRKENPNLTVGSKTFG